MKNKIAQVKNIQSKPIRRDCGRIIHFLSLRLVFHGAHYPPIFSSPLYCFRELMEVTGLARCSLLLVFPQWKQE